MTQEQEDQIYARTAQIMRDIYDEYVLKEKFNREKIDFVYEDILKIHPPSGADYGEEPSYEYMLKFSKEVLRDTLALNDEIEAYWFNRHKHIEYRVIPVLNFLKRTA